MRRLALPMLIACHHGPAPNETHEAARQLAVEDDSDPPPKTVSGPRITYGERPVFCTGIREHPMLGVCFIGDEAECAREQVTLANTTPCVQRTAAACFRFELVVSGNRDIQCATSMENCEGTRRDIMSRADFKVLDEQCFVYRMK